MAQTTIKRLARLASLATVAIGLAIAAGIYAVTARTDEVVLTIGDPYEKVRQQSRSTLPPGEPGASWGGVISRPARLRFADPQYGFLTPAATFIAVSYDEHGAVDSVRLSPQGTPLPLGQTMSIVNDLQKQLRRGGWQPIVVDAFARVDDTPATRAKIRACAAPTGYWLAGRKYQLGLNVRCFRTDSHPDRERYLITVDLSRPWLTSVR